MKYSYEIKYIEPTKTQPERFVALIYLDNSHVYNTHHSSESPTHRIDTKTIIGRYVCDTELDAKMKLYKISKELDPNNPYT